MPDLDRPAPWRTILLALTAITALIFVKDAFLIPGTLAYAPFTIQDDARQFLAWMPRLIDPALLRSDLLADYWQSVSPPLYRWLYGAFAAIGIPPLVLARLIPPILLGLSAWFAWRAALKLTGRPVAAMVAAAVVMALVIHEDSVYSASPRAFSPPLFLLFLDALLRHRAKTIVASLFLLACLYPTTALVGITMVGLSKLSLRPRPAIDFSRGSVALMIVSALVILAAILPFRAETDRWEPTLTIAQARAMPNLGSPDGRTSIVGADGSIDYLCSARMGFLPEMVPCWSMRAAGPLNFLILLPLLILAFRAARAPPGSPRGNLIYLWALIASLGWWLVAIVFAFKLHLPARYPQRVLSILEWLAIGQLLGSWLDARLREGRLKGAALAGALMLALLLIVSFVTPTPGLRRPADPGAITRIAALPPGSMVAGISDELDFVPALTGRAALATTEHAIPYHFGYFGPIRDRMAATLAAVATPDSRELAAFIRLYGVSLIAVEPALIERGEIPPRYATILPAQAHGAAERLKMAPSILQRLAGPCTIYRGPALVLIDGKCLVARG